MTQLLANHMLPNSNEIQFDVQYDENLQVAGFIIIIIF